MDPHHNEEEEYDEGLDDPAEQLGKRPLEGWDDSAEQQKRPLDHGSSCQVGVGGDKIGVGVGVGGEEEFEDHGPSEQEGMKEDQSDKSGYKDNASEDTVATERRNPNAPTRSASAAEDIITIEDEDDESRAGQHRTSEQKGNLLGPMRRKLGKRWGAYCWAPVTKMPRSASEASEVIPISHEEEEEEHDEGSDVSAEQQKHPLDHNHGSPPSDTSGDRTNCQVGVGREEEFE